MKLFRRLLLSLMPDELVQHEMNPAGMFLSFVSPKHFFSVINRKIVENYKLNLFDIGLDSFEVKIGFGDTPAVEVKDMNFYYSYAVVANMNGRSFYSPSNIGVVITMLCAVYVKDVFKNRHRSVFYNFLVTVTILHFVFVSRIKVFPHDEKEKNYQRFIDVFFNFYKITLNSGKQKISDQEFELIKKELLTHIHVFFLLFYVFQRLNTLFFSKNLSKEDFYHRLLYDYQKKSKKSALVKEFINMSDAWSAVSAFSKQDEELIKLLLPTDMMIKYLFHHQHIYGVCDMMLSEIYDKQKLDDIVMSFLKWDEQLEELLTYLFDFRLYKKNYFSSMKRFVSHTFRMQQWYEETQEVDSFINSLQENEGKVDMSNIPESLRKESAMTERFVNFYITFLAWTWVGRWDNFSMRLFEKPLLEEMLTHASHEQLSQETLVYYGAMLYNYSKNVFYYKYAYENVRSGVDKFTLPMRPTIKEVYSNMYIIKLFDENFINTCFQDLNKRNLTLSIANQEIIDLFKDRMSETISRLVWAEPADQFHVMYGNLLQYIPHMSEIISTSDFFARESKGKALRENVYTLDIWIWHEAILYLRSTSCELESSYSELALMWIFASLRETLFGYVLYMTYLTQAETSKKLNLKKQLIDHLYISDILMVWNMYKQPFEHMIAHVMHSYKDLLQKWISLDENKEFFEVGKTNWIDFIQEKNMRELLQEIKWEDIVRFRWFLKNISYYNKRYVVPQ